MKILIYFLILISPFYYSLFAQEQQIKKGVYRVSGSLGISLSSEKHDYITIEENDFQFSGSFNYLILDNLEMGATVSYTYSEEMEEARYDFIDPHYKYEEYYTGLDIGPNLRFYFTSKGIIPFIEVSVLYTAAGRHGGSIQEQASYTAGAGFDYFLTKGLALEPFINYSHLVHKGKARNSLLFGGRINYFIL